MWKFFVVVIVWLVVVNGFSILTAAEGPSTQVQAGDTETKSAENVVAYPVGVVKETAEVAIEAGANVVQTVGGTVEGVVTGNVEKAVTTPIKGSAEIIVDAVEGTVTVPVDAAKSEEDELHKECASGTKEAAKAQCAAPVK